MVGTTNEWIRIRNNDAMIFKKRFSHEFIFLGNKASGIRGMCAMI